MPLLEYRNVDIYHGEMMVLSDVNLSVDAGQFIYLCGRVGSGKSSLLKTMYADLPIKNGEARIFDYDLRKIKKKDIPLLRRKVGIVFQDFQLLYDRSVCDNLEFVLRATGWRKKRQIEDQIKFVLDTVGMSNKGYKWPHQLSGGEQQRIVIARALLNSPQLILADEPTGNLDPDTGGELMQLLQSISEGGTAVLMATHNMQFVEQFSGKMYICDSVTNVFKEA